MDSRQITAGILAGGYSRRMGEDKAFLRRADGCFLTHLANQFCDFGEILVSVRSAERYEAYPYALVLDEQEGFGPIEGIYQLLRRARYPFVFVAAADMQYLTRAFVDALAQQVQQEDVCLVLRRGELVEPLCSIYAKAALPALAELRKKEIHQPRALYEQIKTRYFDWGTLTDLPQIVGNINTEADYDALLRREQKTTKK